MEGDGTVARSSTRGVVLGKLINHVNVHALPYGARVRGVVQRAAGAGGDHTALDPGHREHRPAALASPRTAAPRSPPGPCRPGPSRWDWPPCAIPERVREFADIARQEYVAVGIRSSLHPQIDLATEPRWGRQFHTFGNDSAFVAEVAAAYVEGFQLDRELGPGSVATMAKHFPGGGPQLDGEDPHFPYGREQVYPGGRFDDHLVPFRRAIDGRYVGADAVLRHADRSRAATASRSRRSASATTGRSSPGCCASELGFDGVICTDWGLVTGTVVFGRPLPARAWGVEHLERAGPVGQDHRRRRRPARRRAAARAGAAGRRAGPDHRGSGSTSRSAGCCW